MRKLPFACKNVHLRRLLDDEIDISPCLAECANTPPARFGKDAVIENPEISPMQIGEK